VTAISPNVPAADPPLAGLTVEDVMVAAPKTMLPTATVAEARAFFADDHLHMALITRRGRLVGTLVRSDLAELGDDTGLLAGLVCLKRKLTGFCSDADVAERSAESSAADDPVALRCMPIAR